MKVLNILFGIYWIVVGIAVLCGVTFNPFVFAGACFISGVSFLSEEMGY